MPINRNRSKKRTTSYSLDSDEEQIVFSFEAPSIEAECSTDLEHVLQKLGTDGGRRSLLKKSQKSASRKEKLRIVEPGTKIFGQVADLGVETYGASWIDHIPRKLLRQLQADFKFTSQVNSIQDWMNTMILEDYPGVVMFGDKENQRKGSTRVTRNTLDLNSAIVYALTARLINRIRTIVSSRMEVNCVDAMWDCFHAEEISLIQPYSLLICSNAEEADILVLRIRNCLKPYPKIRYEYVTESLIATSTDPTPSALLIGTISCIRAYLTEFRVDMGRLDSVYVTGCESYTKGSERAELLKEIFNYIKLLKKTPFSTFLSFTKHVKVGQIFLDLLPKNWSLVVGSPEDSTPVVKLYLRTVSVRTGTFLVGFDSKISENYQEASKINWLKGIVDMIDGFKDPKIFKHTLIICESPETCHFLALSLHQMLQAKHPAQKIEVPCITRNSHFLGVERSVNAIQSKSATFMVIERGRLDILEGDNYANAIVFDLPAESDQFMPLMNKLCKLSSYIDDQTRKNIHLLYGDDHQLIRPVYEFLVDVGASIPQTFETMYNSIINA